MAIRGLTERYKESVEKVKAVVPPYVFDMLFNYGMELELLEMRAHEGDRMIAALSVNVMKKKVDSADTG